MVAVKKERVNYQHLRPSEELVRDKQKQNLRKPLSPIVTSGLLVLALVIMGVTVIYRYSIIHSNNAELQRMKAAYNELVDQQNHLQIEAATLSSLARIEGIATESLGLRPPNPEQIIVVNSASGAGEGN